MRRPRKKSRERTIGANPHDGSPCALLVVTVVEIRNQNVARLKRPAVPVEILRVKGHAVRILVPVWRHGGNVLRAGQKLTDRWSGIQRPPGNCADSNCCKENLVHTS